MVHEVQEEDGGVALVEDHWQGGRQYMHICRAGYLVRLARDECGVGSDLCRIPEEAPVHAGADLRKHAVLACNASASRHGGYVLVSTVRARESSQSSPDACATRDHVIVQGWSAPGEWSVHVD